ncbi:uncharacterized protein JCM15063_002039 [Sporobolomyces koalae]|uniref:uncharacterized protein n=1 Tax=Sporobolomyces koalae TaxID=500713 RepID=UPI00317107B0
MFPTSSLFGLCPLYASCNNRTAFPPCLFSHAKPVPAVPPVASTSPAPAPSTAPTTNLKRQADKSTTEPAPKRKALPVIVNKVTANPTPENRVATSNRAASATQSNTSTQPSTGARVRTTVEANVNTGPPRIGMVKGAAHTPLVTRQKMLTAFHTQFVELYTPGILPSSKRYSVASRDALEQEAKIYSKSNKTTYRNGCISALARLKKRPSASRIEETGTMEEYEANLKQLEDAEQGRLTRVRVREFVHSNEKLEKFGYMLDVPAGPGGDIPHEVGQKRNCDRCKGEFVVLDKLTHADRQACPHHYGKMISEKIGGVKQRVWSCCPTPNAVPCQLGPHVFKDEDPADLHARVAFVKTSSLTRQNPSMPSEVQEIVALDCELFYTTAGLSLARLTVVAADGSLLYDSHVMPPPSSTVVDLNTRYSGILESDLAKADKGLEQVRQELARWVGPETIIVGHGVENDLRALRLVHDQVIDTAILFPHPNGGTWRYALRNLTKDILKKFIQDSVSTIGHSAKDDAEAALELVRWKVMQKARGKES